MFRLLLICAALFLLYFGFTLTQSFDSKVFISLYNYNIETTFFFSLISLILLIVLGFIIIRFLILIIDLPIKIHNVFSNCKINNDRYSLVLAFAKYITGNKAKAGSIARKNSSCENLKEFHNLILAETEEDVDKKIAYLQNISKSKEFAFYSNKNLARLYYDKGLYQEAENYAIKAYNLNEYDADNLVTLAYCYGQLALWSKFTFITNKIAKLHKAIPISDNLKIADYYLLANDAEYLESAINTNFVNIPLLELYLNSNNNLNDKKKIKILKDAFQIMPSLEIVKLFKKFTTLSDEQVYEELTKDLDTKKDEILILALKSYLEL
ncbi:MULTISPECIES: tetratricopeptide repeat protein [unclassified Rickettsia]|uniref:tetratricopeptide repeat protein n=1 Tax=unclassified Rickettsia TaxID=114295 RepID=UPI003132DE96